MQINKSQIISASRRSDIPAFFGKWFLEKVQQGEVTVHNPFSGREYNVSLKPPDVAAIVFWSKNYRPLLPILKTIAPLYGNRLLFHYTINAFQKKAKGLFEANIPCTENTLETARLIAERYGSQTLLWRFDPIIFSSVSPPRERLETFQLLAENLSGVVNRCYISFVDLYGKVQRRFRHLTQTTGIHFDSPSLEERIEFSTRLVAIAKQNGIQLFTCCEDDLIVIPGLSKGHCIDSRLLQQLYPEQEFTTEIRPTRTGCGCYASRDIGRYDTCRHRCLYCYANR